MERLNLPSIPGHPTAVKLIVGNYLMLDRAGALAAYGRTELLDGVIYVVSPQHSPHYMFKIETYRRWPTQRKRLERD